MKTLPESDGEENGEIIAHANTPLLKEDIKYKCKFFFIISSSYAHHISYKFGNTPNY
jgi:hypothetical protein